jgi:hypothetical protein
MTKDFPSKIRKILAGRAAIADFPGPHLPIEAAQG